MNKKAFQWGFSLDTSVLRCMMGIFVSLFILGCNDGATRLLRAASNGDTETINVCLTEGSSVYELDSRGRNALMLAARNGHLDTLKFLTNYEVDINQEDGEGWSALLHAASRGQDLCVDYLIQQGAKVDHANRFGNTSLMWAARGGYLNVVHLLLENGADPTARNLLDWDALEMSRRFENPDVEQRILLSLKERGEVSAD